jgi:hypothetical protein
MFLYVLCNVGVIKITETLHKTYKNITGTKEKAGQKYKEDNMQNFTMAITSGWKNAWKLWENTF